MEVDDDDDDDTDDSLSLEELPEDEDEDEDDETLPPLFLPRLCFCLCFPLLLPLSRPLLRLLQYFRFLLLSSLSDELELDTLLPLEEEPLLLALSIELDRERERNFLRFLSIFDDDGS